MSWWVTDCLSMPNGNVFLGSWIFWIIFSIVIHELSHGWAAIRLGDDTPIHSGHMTWNPIVHMGYMSLIFLAIIGIAWGAMPVNPNRLRGRYGESIVAIAGPLSNLGLFLITSILAVAWLYIGPSFPDHVEQNVTTFLFLGSMLNVVLMIFNLVPIPPLDGSRIVGDIYPRYKNIWNSEYGAVIGIVAMIALFTYGSVYIWRIGAFVTRVAQTPLELLCKTLFGMPPA